MCWNAASGHVKPREAVFKAKKKLHGTNMFANDYYSDRVIKRRTELMPKLKEARRKNQRAFLRFDKLVIYNNPVNSGSTNGERVSGESSSANKYDLLSLQRITGIFTM